MTTDSQHAAPGWRCVPEELTPEMLVEAQDCADILPPRARRLWKALLGHAPAAPSQSAGVVLQGDRDDPPDVSLIADPVLREVVTAYGNGLHYEGLQRVAALLRQSRSAGEPVAWSILDKRTGRHWYTHESPYTAQHYANHYSHREPDGSPSMVIVPLYASPPPTDAARKEHP